MRGFRRTKGERVRRIRAIGQGVTIVSIRPSLAPACFRGLRVERSDERWGACVEL